MRNKRRPGKTPACLCALAVILSALGRLGSAPQVQAQTQAEWQDVPGGNFLTGSTVSGDIGKIIADTATGTFTSGGQYGTVYLDLYKAGSEERAKIAPSEGALLYYDFTVAMVDHDLSDESHAYHGKARIEPNPWGTDGAAIADAFMNGVAANKEIDFFEGKLPAGDYQGTLDVSAVWKTDNGTDCIALLLNEYTRVTFRALKFVEPKTESTDVPGGNLLYKYTPACDKNVVCDAETGTFTNSDTADADIILDLYQGEGGRASIKPAAGSVLAYDITVNTGSAYILPDAWTAEGGYNYSVGDAFIRAVNEAHGTGGGSSSLGEGHYTGTVDLSAVWPEDKGAASVLVRLPAGSSVTLKTLRFVTSGEALAPSDVPGGDLLADYTPAADKEQAVCDKTTGTFSNNGSETADFWLQMTSPVKPADGARLVYEIDVTAGNLYISPCCPSAGEHNYSLGDAFIKSVNTAAQMSDNPSRLLPGHYEGTVDLSAAWTSDQAAAYVLVRLPAGAQATIRTLKFITLVATGETVDSAGGNLLAAYKAAGSDVGKITADKTERVFTSAENWGELTLAAAQAITPATDTKLYYDFSIAMVEHTPDDNAHEYHGKAAVRFSLPGAADETAKKIAEEISAGIAGNQHIELFYDAFRPGDYKGTVDIPADWNADLAATGLTWHLNEFTRVTIREWKLVSEISQPTVSYIVSIPSGTQRISSGGVTSIGSVSVTEMTANSGDSLSVTASSGEEYALVQGEGRIPYTLTTDDQGAQAFTSFTFDAVDSRPLYIAVAQPDWETAPAGDYTDMITFTVTYHPAASAP